MSADRPINAEVPPLPEPEPDRPQEPKPAPKQAKAAAPKAVAKKPARPVETKPAKPLKSKPAKRRRQPIPGALKLVAALVALAVLFIVVAVLAGGGSPAGKGAPAAGTETVTVQTPSTDGDSESAPAQPASALGFPALATANTTRVGGADAAANAAGVALAVFPSTTEAQRPTAVTLVDEDEPLAAIAAAVLVAEPVRAPILISAGELPDPSAEALAALDPQGGKASGGASIFAVGDVATPDGAKVKHLPGGDPAAAAAAIAALRDRLFGSAPDHILVVAAADPTLAMPAAAWAARSGDPVLFAEADSLPQASAEYLSSHNRLPVYVVGPSSAISSDVLREIEKVGGKAKRVSGEDAVANAIAMARYSDGSFGWNVNDPGHGFVLARSDEPLAAAAAAPLSAAGTWGPLLLTDGADTLPAELRDYFLDLKPGYTNDPTRAFYNHVWVIGDQEAIDVDQQAEVNELAELAKIGGGPRERDREPAAARTGERDHRRGHPRPRRRLHPPLRAPGPQPHPPPDRAAARRPPGAAGRRTQDRQARGSRRAQRRPPRHPRHRALARPR